MGVWIETDANYLSKILYAVTPCVGVWIETMIDSSNTGKAASHTLRGCVDWNVPQIDATNCSVGHTLRGCVDWNIIYTCFNDKHNVTPCVGVWIETSLIESTITIRPSHPAWVCGLKPELVEEHPCYQRHTLRGCVDWNQLVRPL